MAPSKIVDRGELPGTPPRTWSIAKTDEVPPRYALTIASPGGEPEVSLHAHLGEARARVGRTPTPPATSAGAPTPHQGVTVAHLRGIKAAYRAKGLSAALALLEERLPERAADIRAFSKSRDEWVRATLPEACARIDALVAADPDRYEYADTYRAARVGDLLQEVLYDLTAAGGCCGSYDGEETIAGVRYRIGFNYGH